MQFVQRYEFGLKLARILRGNLRKSVHVRNNKRKGRTSSDGDAFSGGSPSIMLRGCWLFGLLPGGTAVERGNCTYIHTYVHVRVEDVTPWSVHDY